MRLVAIIFVSCCMFIGTLVGHPAHAEPIPFGSRHADLTAREQPIAGFLQDLFGVVGIPVVISPSAKGVVNGHFDGPAEKVYRNIARAFNLVEYYDGSVLHIGTPQDMVTRTLPLDAGVSERLMRTVAEIGMADERNKLRVSSDGMLTASGARRFIEQVEEMARAQAVGQRAGAAAQPHGFRVFYLRYAWAQDVTMNFGGRQVMLPGVASTVRALMTSNSRSQVSTTSAEQPSRNTVPRSRGNAGGNNPSRQGTLGAPDADVQLPSGPTLAAVYAAGGLPGAVANLPAPASGAAASGTPPPGIAPGDAQQVRVEADARLNAVLVRDAPERMLQYEQLIAALDVEPQSIEIEATIIDVNTDKLRELGINWRYTKGRASLLFGRGDDSDLQLTPTTSAGDITGSGRGGFISAILGNAAQFITRINALQEQGAAKVVSSPQVLTLSNVEAVFDNSQTFYVRVAGRDDVDLFNVSAGTMLRVMPHVFKDGNEVRIKMLVAIEDGSLSTRTVDTLPVVERSSINTQAMIFEGESLLVGGITRESSNDSVSKVPLLGDVPYLGALFRTERKSSERIERMFLISPRLAPRRAAQARLPAPPASPASSGLPQPESAPRKTAPREATLRVQDRRGPSQVYRRGEQYEVEVAVQQSGYLYCYLIDERRQLHQFFPNSAVRSAAVSAGSVLSFPGEHDFHLVANQQAGTETVACMNSEKDLGFTPIAAVQVDDSEALRRLGELAGQKVQVAAFEVKVP